MTTWKTPGLSTPALSENGLADQGKSNPAPELQASEFRRHPRNGHFMQLVDPAEALDPWTREDLALAAWSVWRAGLREQAAARSRARRLQAVAS